MVYKKGKGKRKRNYSRKGKVVKISNRQAKTHAYDSKIEKIIARVARKEDMKHIQKLEFRQYLFGPYDIATNIYAAATRVHYVGFVQALARVQKLDNATAFTVPAAAQPFQTPATYIPPGTNVIAPVNGRDGFRIGDWISIYGIQLQIRCFTNLIQSLNLPRYENAYLYWKLCAVHYDGSDLPNALPQAHECLKLPRFGYSSKLDTAIAQDDMKLHIKTFASGKIKMRMGTGSANVEFRNHYVSLAKNPLKVEYNPLSQSGESVERWKPFLVLRSNIPDTQGTTVYQPAVNVCTRIFYTDNV